MENILYQIAITQIPKIGDIIGKKLIAACGSVEAVFLEKKQNLLKIEHIGETLANQIIKHRTAALKRAEEEIPFIEKHGIQTIFYLNTNYPERLKQCSDSPIMLYYKGSIPLHSQRIVSVVGTRKATSYGIGICNQLIQDLSNSNVIIVSGLAYGIDAIAHKAAIDNKLPTLGVLAHGLDRIYPAAHKSLATKMITQGGLLTEYLKNTNPDRENFPSRNRIVAGLSDATIVIESGIRGGAIITAEIANSYNRDVFVFPGRVHDEYSLGCNYMIKHNKAALIENAEDLKFQMGWNDPTSAQKNKQMKLFVKLSEEEEIIVAFIQTNEPCSIDFICTNLTITTSKIAAALLNLELNGIVKALPGKLYKIM